MLTLVTSPHQWEEALPLLMDAMGRWSAVSEWGRRYLTDPEDTLWVWETPRGPVGVIGFHRQPGRSAEITHIAIHSPWRGRGLGRQLIQAAWSRHPDVEQLVLETDDDAIAFYRRLGWDCQAIGPKKPGWRTRYRCTCSRNDASGSIVDVGSHFMRKDDGA
ncbi:GNAT family N-acetyltransferase [Sulfobacillus harzensis]|uniref:GNAT family N-acetyltransferase n=1 Tax=Sulfobacillus harzensis TaxID=2729629 RepID=A0A7Y0Q3E2_9FIRM|nr:GNAT family N-acetyltransferase [Sulfobacillus harzensis]NMP22876.1 GNAT family N-acetyltransferase [Sulfobacillus harzensis]